MRLYNTEIRRSGMRGEQRMAELERRAHADAAIIAALRRWRSNSSSAARAGDLLLAVIASYELELEQLGL